MILDKLLEKKDLRTYIINRIKWLENEKKKVMKNLPKPQREKIWERFNGRILELECLMENIHTIKDMSKHFFELYEKFGEKKIKLKYDEVL